MKSILKLYKVEFKPELNPLVENLESYLADCDRTTYGDFQYIKHDLSIVVKIPMSQEFVNDLQFNYASIKNSDSGDTFYYYIMDVNWVAQNTIALTLGMDTVNTFGQTGSLGNPANFTDETHIYRQHGDRFYDTGERDQAGGKLLRRRIDREAEGFDVPMEKTRTTVANDVEFGAYGWSIMYKSTTEGSVSLDDPLDVFLVPEKEYQVRLTDGTTGSKRWDVENFQPGTYYYFTKQDNPGGQLTADGNYFLANPDRSWSVGGKYDYIKVWVHVQNDGTKKFAIRGYSDSGNIANGATKYWNNYDYIVWQEGIRVRYSTQDVNWYSRRITSDITNTIELNANVTAITLKPLSQVDHYDPKILNIIKLPYCPIDATINSEKVLSIPAGWIESEGYLKWDNKGVPQLYRNNATNFTINLVDYWYPSERQNKEVGRESKLYHSELFTFKAVYDSYSKPIALERFDLSETDPGRITVDFKQTNTLGNNMMFRFNFENFAPYQEIEDYENILLVDRNNEEPIFSSNYLNYLRNGYQYDVANNKLAERRAKYEAWNTTLTSAVNVGVTGYNSWGKKEGWLLNGREISATQAERIGEAFDAGRISLPNLEMYERRGFYKGGTNVAPLVFQNALNSVSSAASSWINYSNLLKTQKLQMNAKFADLQAQSVGVSGSGTIDLLEDYNGNKINIMRYEPRLTIKRRLYDYFDFFGYSHDYYEVPNIASRYWYNYIQCSPMLVEEGLGKYKEVWLEDLKARYEIGVTVFHDRNGEWNFKRRWENWETWVITE